MPDIFHWWARIFLPGSVALALASCAIHPLPEDVSGVSTYDIVERIRCEGKEGLRSFRDDDFDAWEVATSTLIGFNFSFDMDTLHGAGVDQMRFKKLNPPHAFDLNTTATASFARDNRRFFQIIEKLTDMNAHDCAGKLTPRNPVYPVTGSIGMSEVIKTFINIEKITDLRKVSNTMFTDTLSFTTAFGFGVKSSWELSAGVASLHLTNLNVSAGSSRTDAHNVTVTLTRHALPGNSKSREERRALVDLIKSRSIRDPRTQAALVQQAEDAYTRTAIELRRQRDLVDDKREAARILGERMLDILKLP